MNPENVKTQTQQEAEEHLQQSSLLMRQLGELASVPLKAREEQVKLRDEAWRSAEDLTHEKLASDERDNNTAMLFFEALPRAMTSRYESIQFKSKNIKEAALIDASVVWLPVQSRFDRYSKRGEEDGDWSVREGLAHSSVELHGQKIWTPAYIVGHRQLRANKGMTDAVDEILLAPAFPIADEIKPRVLKALVSARSLERLDELSVEKLASPHTDHEYWRLEGKDFVSFDQTSIRKLHPGHNPSEDEKSLVRELPPGDETVQAKLLGRLDKHLLHKGLEINLISPEMLTRQMIEEFDVASHTRKLAILFDAESIYADTIGQLVAA